MYLYPAQVLAAELLDYFVLAWDQTLDGAGVVILSMLGPQRNKRYQSNPETPQPARHTTDLPSWLQEHTNTQQGGVCVCVLSNSMDVNFTVRFEAIITGLQDKSQMKNKKICKLDLLSVSKNAFSLFTDF